MVFKAFKSWIGVFGCISGLSKDIKAFEELKLNLEIRTMVRIWNGCISVML
jgi:hypothetical protein